MTPLLERHRARIETLCLQHGVKRLDVFGSAARGDDFTDQSDVDFLVELLRYDDREVADRWFSLEEGLAETLGRKVDLTSARTLTNPVVRRLAERDRVTLYGR